MPNPRLILRLAAAGPFEPRTVRAWLSGRDVRGNILRARLEEAARSLGIERESAPPVTPTAPSPPRAA